MTALNNAGLVAKDATDEQKAQLGYIAHHEGTHGAIKLLSGNMTQEDVQDKMDQNMSAEVQRKYLKANNNDPTAAYTAWLGDYARAHITPDKFRCSKGAAAK